MIEKYKLELLRNGKNQWNLENCLIWWIDVDLTNEEVKEAIYSVQVTSKIFRQHF